MLESRQTLSAVMVTTASDISNNGDTSSIDALLAHPGSDGKISLREAILAANQTGGSNTITFDPRLIARGRVSLTPVQVGDITADNSAFAITSSLEIVGAVDPNLITLKGTGPHGDVRLFRVLAGGALTLRGLTMTNWSTDTNGAVLAVDPTGSASLTNCTLSNNSAVTQGGAIFNLTGKVTLSDCTLSENRAHDGGAYQGTYAGVATFSNCILRGNTAVDRGGAIALENGGIDVTNCSLVGNTAHQGGGIAGGYIVMSHSSLIRNTAIDGGAIFASVGGGAAEYRFEQVGAPGDPSSIGLSSCTFTGNSAQHRGGGVYLVKTGGRIVNCAFTRNHAQQGGGVFEDNSAFGFLIGSTWSSLPFGFQIKGTDFSANSAILGGGIFNGGGATTVSDCTFHKNIAQRGAALYTEFGWAAVTDSTVAENFSAVGTQLFNHLGILPLTHSTVSDIAKMTFLFTDSSSGTQFAATNPGLPPAAVRPRAGTAIVTGLDGIRYALNPDRVLLRQLPGCNWSVLDDKVQSFQITPNGDCVWLNDRRDLYRSQAGSIGDLIGQAVQSYAVDQRGTVYDLSSGNGPGNFAAYRTLTEPLLDPVEEPLSGPHFAQDPPSSFEVVRALSITSRDQFFDNGSYSNEVVAPDPLSSISNVRIIVEPIVDRIDPPSYFPNVGLAQMHHAHYKCTVYYDTTLNGSLIAVVYLDRNHLHRYVVGQDVVSQDIANSPTSQVAPASQNQSVAIAEAVNETDADADRSDKIHSLWTSPDETIYKLGGDYNGTQFLGKPPVPLVLWRLAPGGPWEALFRVHAVEVAPDNTLFILNTNHELQRLPPGTSQWTTVASGVQSFSMTKDGTVYALDGSGQLLRQQRVRHSNRWVLSTLDHGVRSFALTADGVLYDWNQRNELRRFTGIGHRFALVQSKVSSLQQAADGTIYALHQSGQLQRLERGGRWSILGRGVQSFQLDPDGVLYALDRQHALTRLTAGGHWSLVDIHVQAFVVAPNGLRNVYILSTHHELKRLEAGYSWLTLRTDAVSVSIDAKGIVTARDTLGRSWLYWSPFTAPNLDPVEGDNAPVFCVDPPLREDFLRLLDIPDGPNVEIVIVEPTEDTLDPPRWFTNLGDISAVRLHHCRYQCTVQYTDSTGLRTVVIEIDSDHLIRHANVNDAT